MATRYPLRLFPLALLALAGCGGGGQSLISLGAAGSSAATGVSGYTLDAGATLPITASVINDSSHAGATFALTGPGTLGPVTLTTIADSDTLTVPYTAPSPATAGTVVNVTATSAHSPAQKASLTITLNPALAISTATLPNAVVGTAYKVALTTTGGTGNVTFAATGALPAGLTLNATTGVLSGTPTTAGAYPFTITVTDAASVPGTGSQTYTLTVNGPPPVVTAVLLPTAASGLLYSQQLAYTGGTGTPNFAVTSGALPTGLTLSASGLLSGTPAVVAANQVFSFSVSVTTGTQTSAAVAYTLTVAALPTVTTTSLPAGNVGVPYSQQLAFSGGVGTPSFAVSAGSLPPGLTLTAAGVLAGIPTTAAGSSFSVTVTAGAQTSVAQPLTLVVNSLIITSSPTALGEAALPFSFRLTAAGGTGPYTWSLAAGTLPTGLTLNGATGLITGNVATAGTTTVTVKASDSVAATTTQTLTITINPARGSTNNALFSGSYAFLLSGFDSTGRPEAAAGRFTADGAGNITGGILDINGTGLAAAQTSVALLPGTYSVGSDNRGKLTLVTGAGTSTYTFALDTLVSGVATGGSIAQFDLSGQTLSGTLALQTSAAFSAASLNSGFAFGLGGFAANSTATTQTHRAAIGELQFNGANTIASSELLLSSASTSTPVVPTTGALALAPNGRGTLSLTLPNITASLSFIVYVVSPTRFFLLSSDPASGTANTRDLLSGQALAQTTATGSFNNASLNAPTIFHAESLVSTTLAPQVELGLLAFNGAGLATQSFDENSGGTLTTNSATGTYTVAANGRTSLALAAAGLGGCTDCTGLSTYAYLTGSNQGFLLDFSAAAFSGFFEPQTSSTPAAGAYSLGTPEPLSAPAAIATGTINLAGNSYTGSQDTARNLTLTPDGVLAVTTAVGTNGRFTTGQSTVGYVVSATRILSVDNTTRPVLQFMQHQ